MTNFEDLTRYSGPSIPDFGDIELLGEQAAYWAATVADLVADADPDEWMLQWSTDMYRKLRNAHRFQRQLLDHMLEVGKWSGCIVPGQYS